MIVAFALAQELMSIKQQAPFNQADHQAMLAAFNEAPAPNHVLPEAWQLDGDKVVRS